MVLSPNICKNIEYSFMLETTDFLAFLQNEPED